MRAIDLFSGGGGFTRGMVEAGIGVVGAVEIGEWEARTYSYNFPSVYLWNDDIRNLHAEDIQRTLGKPDLIFGGPPCEAYTSSNARRYKEPLLRLYEDPRGRLTLHFIRMVGDLQPEVFVMENVVGILDGDLKEALSYEFGRIGYEVRFNVLRAEDAGVPSQRLRTFLSNVRIKVKKQRAPKVIEAIGDLIELDDSVPNHRPASLTKKLEERAWKLPWGSSLTYFRGSSSLLRNYIKLHPYRLAPTVMGSSRFIHPFEGRLLTPREHARLMGYPDDHVFLGPLERQYNMAGESVPPPLARQIGERILKKVGEI